MPSTTANSSSFSSSSMTSPLVEEEMSAEERSLVEDDATSNRSHSICVVPSDFSTSSSQEPHSKDSNSHAHPSPEATKKTALPEIKIVDLGGNDKNSNLKVHDSGLEATAASHRVSSEDINLTCRQISKDKTEGLAHLDPHSILQNPVHEELLRGHSHAHLNVQPSPPITRPPTSILRDPSGSGSQHGSFFELKHLQHAGRYANGGVPGSGVELASGLTIDGGKRAFFETGPPKRQTWATQQDPNLDPVDGIVSLLSAIYCKIIVVIGLCFPMAEVISHRIPISWYEGFYLYLYTGSILFLIFVYIFLLNRKGKPGTFARAKIGLFRLCRRMTRRKRRTASSGSPKKGGEDEDTEQSSSTASFEDSEEADEEDFQQIQCGSFYLRVGAVAFGVGSMIYSGLEFGQFFELESKEHCYSFMYGLTPGSHMIFTFIQLYFIFMNSRVIIARHKLIARFGLMHMIGTNICVWLHVLIQETKHQIMTMVETNSTELGSVDLSHAWDHVDDVVEEMSEDYIDSISSHPLPHPHTNRNTLPPGSGSSHASIVALVNSTLFPSTTTEPSLTTSGHASILPGLHRSVRSLNDHYITHSDCRRSNIIGELVSDSSQFLFPCTIEYSLICAAILYIMWKSISDMRRKPIAMCPISKQPTTLVHHQKHHYQVDCAKAHKGLFTGIFLMVICIISLILFFVFIKKDQYRNLAVLQAHIVELVIYCINAIACLIALFQVRELNYNRNRGVELDNILLIIAQSGLCIFTMFSIIGAQFISQLQNTRLVLINAFACLIQSTLQSVFILDASKRKASTADQVRRKPGREMVTFLLVCNFSMWAINTLETRRAESNPVQMSFYGFWAWTIITHVTMPLTIFYRFHSTVCLCEIWKGTYKIKSEYL